MFAKSKRFPEATKDYIPGPGEYNIPSAEELSRHKRYGFLNHTNRFSADGPVDITGDLYLGSENSVGSLSSETRLSLSTSSNKTEDARSRRQMSEMASQFEKYRLAMQKEIESLQLKNRKFENNLKSVTSEKDAAQATLLHKDQELAEMRLKNAQLQKTVTRLEKNIDKSPKVIQLQKRVDQAEKELEANQQETALIREAALREKEELSTTLSNKDGTIEQLEQQLEQQQHTMDELHTRISDGEEELKNVQHAHQLTMDSLHTQIQGLQHELASTRDQLEQQQQQHTQMQNEISGLRDELSNSCMQNATLEAQMQDLKHHHKAEQEAWHEKHQTLEHNYAQQQKELRQRADEITHLRSQLDTTRHDLETLQQSHAKQTACLERKNGLCLRLQTQFDVYRNHVTTIMHAMREQMNAQQPHHLSRELLEAKKFINHQALQIEGLKSELHWMSKWNRQLTNLIDDLHNDDVAQNGAVASYRCSTRTDNAPATTTTTTPSSSARTTPRRRPYTPSPIST
ncbi:hypothetical protein O0I10_002295 [Lichtheimia ornata]|uniref:Uncharacterized protein n=1 Tax=Lichtheimia ornata TaxID=688661 RepID=A0AAD7VAG7_9FUNG|nr:uncharacterized protein O0I10_002295 [Lichtheimia ornata]KAJ8661964.1 hypothetical protein O0I10_002295 [Lichtheimia ornata]